MLTLSPLETFEGDVIFTPHTINDINMYFHKTSAKFSIAMQASNNFQPTVTPCSQFTFHYVVSSQSSLMTKLQMPNHVASTFH